MRKKLSINFHQFFSLSLVCLLNIGSFTIVLCYIRFEYRRKSMDIVFVGAKCSSILKHFSCCSFVQYQELVHLLFCDAIINTDVHTNRSFHLIILRGILYSFLFSVFK